MIEGELEEGSGSGCDKNHAYMKFSNNIKEWIKCKNQDFSIMDLVFPWKF